MRTLASPKLAAYAGLGAAGLTAALLFGRPEAAALGLPFVLVLLVGLASAQRPRLQLRAELDRDRIVQGDHATLLLDLEAENAVDGARVSVPLPAGLEPAEGSDALEVRLVPGEHRPLTLPVAARRWGGYVIGSLDVEARDPFGLYRFVGNVDAGLPLRVFPRPEALHRPVRPLETQAWSGDETSRRTGEGIEFADVRPFAPGDRIRSVNWRVSSRERDLHVNDLHPERNRDVVLLLDTFADTTLDEAVRATWTLAARYLRQRDRVGLIGFGGTMRWLTPALGEPQRHRIAEALIDTEVVLSYAWKGIETIPPRMLPPKALVLALTPLLDARVVNALFDLRARRFDVAILEVSPEPSLPPIHRPPAGFARRIWRLERESLRQDLRQLGVAVAVWSPGEPLTAAIEEVEAFRRFARRAPA